VQSKLRGAKTSVCEHLVQRLSDKTNSNSHRYLMSMAVADYSGQAWLQGFNDVGEIIFGMTANELLSIKDRDSNEFTTVMEKSTGHTYNFSCRAKQDTWKVSTSHVCYMKVIKFWCQDTPRIRYGISRITKLDYKEEAIALRDLLYSQWAR
jgi:replication factor A1